MPSKQFEHLQEQSAERLRAMIPSDELTSRKRPPLPDYTAHVRAVIRKRLFERWPPRSEGERAILERNARFFETECTFDEADAEGRTVEEVADDEIDAASDLS